MPRANPITLKSYELGFNTFEILNVTLRRYKSPIGGSGIPFKTIFGANIFMEKNNHVWENLWSGKAIIPLMKTT